MIGEFILRVVAGAVVVGSVSSAFAGAGLLFGFVLVPEWRNRPSRTLIVAIALCVAAILVGLLYGVGNIFVGPVSAP